MAPALGLSASVSPLGRRRGGPWLSCDQEEDPWSEGHVPASFSLPLSPKLPPLRLPALHLCGSQGHRLPSTAVSERGSPWSWVCPIVRGPCQEAISWALGSKEMGPPAGGWGASRDWVPYISQSLPSSGASQDTSHVCVTLGPAQGWAARAEGGKSVWRVDQCPWKASPGSSPSV